MKAARHYAGVILAAGASSRLGIPKQVINWMGKPIVRHIAEIALSADLDPVVVVTGCNRDVVEEALSGLPIGLVHNSDWRNGQGSSISAGLKVLSWETRACFFLMSDQPFITKKLLDEIATAHLKTSAQIVVPCVNGIRTSPVLFDQTTFRDLSDLSGDIGGRSLFNRYQIQLHNWKDTRLLFDIDSPEDLERIKEYPVDE